MSDVPVFLPTQLLLALQQRRVLPIVGLGVPDYLPREINDLIREGGTDSLEDLADWFARAAEELSPVYRAMAGLPVDSVLALTPDEELFRELLASDRWVSLRADQTEYDDTRRLFLPLGGNIADPSSVLLTDEDWLDAPQRKPVLWELAQSYAARSPLMLIGCDPSDRRLRHIVNELRPHPYFRPAGWLLCEHILEADFDRWQDMGFQIVLAPRESILRELRVLDTKKAMPSEHPILARRSPYLRLDAFQRTDGAFFFGRERDTRRLIDLVCAHRLVIVTGPSGTGKTSLLNAGLLAWTDRNPPFVGVYVRCGNNPADNLVLALAEAFELPPRRGHEEGAIIGAIEEVLKKGRGLPVVVLDQVEELFTRFENRLREQFLRSLRSCLTNPRLPIRLVLSLRDDYLVRLVDLRETIPSLLQNTMYVPPLSREGAIAAICRPCNVLRPSVQFDESLAERILKDIGTERVAPPQIQIVCERLYQEREARGVTLSLYERLGEARVILNEFMAEELKRMDNEQSLACEILKAMVTSERTKDVLTLTEIARRARYPTVDIASIVLRLRDDCRLVRSVLEGDEIRFELAHEYLIDAIWEWMTQDDKDRREIEELLAKELRSWHQFDSIRLGLDRLRRVESYIQSGSLPCAIGATEPLDVGGNRDLDLSEECLILLLLSSVRHQRTADRWIESIRRLGIEAQDRAASRLFAYFTNADLNQRCEAAEAIAQLDLSPLLRALDSPQPETRTASLYMLGGLARSETIGAVERLITDPDDTCAALACGAIGAIGGEKAFDRLFFLITSPDTRTGVLLAATKALDCSWPSKFQFDDGRCIRSLLRLINQGSPPVKCAALRAIGHAGDYPAVIDAIRAGLLSHSAAVVEAAKRAAVSGKSPFLISRLLMTNNKQVQDAVWEAIAGLSEDSRYWFSSVVSTLPQKVIDDRWYEFYTRRVNWLSSLLWEAIKPKSGKSSSHSRPSVIFTLADYSSQTIRDALRGGNREEAVKAVASRGLEEDVWRAIAADSDSTVRICVLHAAKLAASVRAKAPPVRYLLEAAKEDREVTVQLAACHVAEIYGEWDVLHHFLQQSCDERVIARALQGLAKSPKEQLVSEFLVRQYLTGTAKAGQRYWACQLVRAHKMAEVLDLVRPLAWDQSLVERVPLVRWDVEHIDSFVGARGCDAAGRALDVLSPFSSVWRKGSWQSIFHS